MILELHLGSIGIGEAVKNFAATQALSTDVGLAGTMEIPYPNLLSSSTATMVVDHVALGDVEVVSRRDDRPVHTVQLPPSPRGSARAVSVPSQQVGIDVVLNLYLVRVADLQEAGPEAVPESSMVEARAKVQLNLGQPVLTGAASSVSVPIVANKIQLGIGGTFLDADAAPGAVRPLLNRLNAPSVLGSFAVPPLSVDLSELLGALDTESTVWNVGLAVSSTPRVLIVRVQLEPDIVPDPFGAVGFSWRVQWQQFYASPRGRTSVDGWSVFLPAGLFTSRIEGTIEDALAPNPTFIINDDNRPHSTWSVEPIPSSGSSCSPGGQAHLTTRFSASAIGACEPWGLDVDVNVALPVEISMPSPGTLRLDLELQYEPDPGDLALCGILNSHLTAGGGLAIGGAIGGWVGAVIGAIVGGLAGGITTLVVGYETGAPVLTDEDLEPVPGREDTYYYETSLPAVSNDMLGDLVAETLTPCADGLLLGGTLDTPAARMPSLYEVATSGFAWRLADSACPPGTPVARAYIDGRVSLGSTRVPVTLWGTPVLLGAPDGYADALRITARDEPARYRIDLDMWHADVRRLRRSDADTLDPVRILVQSNAGARILSLDAIGDDLSDEAMQEVRGRQARICEARERRLEDFERRAGDLIEHLGERLGPLPDIPDGWPSGGFRWHLRLAGLDPLSIVRLGVLQNGNFDPRHSIEVDAQGHLNVELWLDGGTDPHLAMHIEATSSSLEQTRPTNGVQRAFAASLERYVGLAAIRTVGDVRGRALFYRQGAPHVGIVTPAGIYEYDLANPMQPHLHRRIYQSGLSSLVATEHGLVAWGGVGATLMRHRGAPVVLTDRCVDSVASSAGGLTVNTPARAFHFDAQGQPLHEACAAEPPRARTAVPRIGHVDGVSLHRLAVVRNDDGSGVRVLALERTILAHHAGSVIGRKRMMAHGG